MKISEEGIILIDKPKGITSFDVIRLLRKKIGMQKMGHAGTLDPLATGLMIIAVGKATKKLSELLGLPKVYEAEILLGVQTDTSDVQGMVLAEKEVQVLTAENAAAVIKSMEGKIDLSVPLYSAIKRQGKPLYDYARKGLAVDVPVKTMEVIQADLISFTENTITAIFNVKSGTYIRSLAEEIGKRLNTVATLKNLRRTSVGDFKVESAEKIEV